jgi:hypothetical protein
MQRRLQRQGFGFVALQQLILEHLMGPGHDRNRPASRRRHDADMANATTTCCRGAKGALQLSMGVTIIRCSRPSTPAVDPCSRPPLKLRESRLARTTMPQPPSLSSTMSA